MTKAKIEQFDFNISKKLAKSLLSEDSAALLFKSNGNLSFKIDTLPKSLQGLLHISTNTNKGIAHLMEQQEDGTYGVDLILKNGNYSINGISLGPDLLSSKGFSKLLKSVDQNTKVSKAVDAIDDKLNQAGSSLKNLFK